MNDLYWIEVSPVETEFWFKNVSDSKFVASIHGDGGVLDSLLKLCLVYVWRKGANRCSWDCQILLIPGNEPLHIHPRGEIVD
eukprot:scaffold11928_cov98-Cylindrotheca_fusiformis.AAC.2